MSAISHPAPNLLPALTAPDALPDIVGGEVNLIPLAAAQAPLRLEFPPWTNSNPSPQTPETLTLYWNNVAVESKVWDAPIAPGDHFIMAPLAQLTNGAHVVFYELRLYTGVVTGSDLTTLTIDKTAPVLAPGNGLIFPAEVIAGGVTEQYLAAHNDELLANLPRYNDPRLGDTLTWFWDETPSERNVAGTKTLASADLPGPLVVTFKGDMIRDSGNGPRQAYYEVKDRAGNAAPLSGAVTIDSAASPVPRTLPWPDVKDAAGAGEHITLAPEKAASGCVIIVPDTADIFPDETIWAQWAEPGELGFYRTSTPEPAGSRRYTVPTDYVAPFISKQLKVSYEAKGPNSTVPSRVRELEVLALDSDRLPIIQIVGLTGTSLSLASIPADGLALHLRNWALIATTQRVKIMVSGVAADGQATETVVIDNHPVSQAELVSGVSANVIRHFMAGLRLNSTFTISVYVSFDQGVTWPSYPNFPLNNNVMLVA